MTLARALAVPLVVGGVAACAISACNAIFGVDDYEIGPANEGGGAAGQGGAGAAEACIANEVESCYEGPEETLDVGPCVAGERICAADGSGFGPCDGQILPALEDCVSEEDEDCNGAACGETRWSRAIGGQGATSQAVTAVGAGADAVFVAGIYETELQYGGTVLVAEDADDGFIAKFDPETAVLDWLVGVYGVSTQQPEAVAVDSVGNVIVAGTFRTSLQIGAGSVHAVAGGDYDVFVTKLGGADYAESWTRVYGSAMADGALGVAVSENDEIAVVGYYGGPMSVGDTMLDVTGAFTGAFVTVLDTGGNPQWAAPITATGGNASATAVAFGPEGRVLVAGRFAGTADIDGSLYPASSDDGFAVGYTEQQIDGVKVITGAGNQVPLAIGVIDDDVVIAGQYDGMMDLGDGLRASAGGIDGFVVRYPADFASVVWSQRLENTGGVALGSAAVDGLGQITLVGGFDGTVDAVGHAITSSGGKDVFVVKVDADGAYRFSKRFGDGDDESATDVAVSPARDIYVGGSFFGDIDFGTNPHTAQLDDGFIVKLAP